MTPRPSAYTRGVNQKGLAPHVWAHFDRYFVTGEVLGDGSASALAICASRWSPRNDWQLIKVELRNLDAARLSRITPPTQRLERRPKAALTPSRRVRSGWFPDEAELSKLQPLSPALLSTLGHEVRSLVSQHILAYDLVEDAGAGSPDQVVTLTARRYRQLVNIGETSPASAISKVTGIPVRTIQNRLRVARERGLLPHSGKGTRRQVEPIPPTAEDLRLVARLVGPEVDGVRPSRSVRQRSHRQLRPRGRVAIRKG